ncbi:MAG: endonuclease/exonuclease/phosphatase family protein [Chloroflexi bacterium]|nr:endonuclease/exonuclease/phosphatase family protein [Chloroflexota bacterium]MDA1147402.1 endonuclease/exonuclease/phosphatase family protein [Chloroflexota bacterium]
MRIVSVNAWGGAMFDALVEWLPTCRADVLCFQEVTRTPGLRGWTSFDDTERQLPQRANLFDDLRDALPDHQGFFVASDAGPVMDGDGHQHRQDFGLAIFISQQIPVIGQAAAFVHGDFVDHEVWATTDRPRVAQAVRLVDRAADRRILVTHLHGLRDAAGKHDTPARRRQAKRLIEVIGTLREPDDLVILGGDFNLLPNSETFELLAKEGLVDLVGDADTRTSRYLKPVRHASYLLVSDISAVKSFEAPATPEVSDHRLLVLDV